jgi:hypothetical protein
MAGTAGDGIGGVAGAGIVGAGIVGAGIATGAGIVGAGIGTGAGIATGAGIVGAGIATGAGGNEWIDSNFSFPGLTAARTRLASAVRTKGLGSELVSSTNRLIAA